jgi:hypothetical protein
MPIRPFASEAKEINGTWFKRVTPDEWAKFCARYRCTGTEPDKDTMDHYISSWEDGKNVLGEWIARVDYSNYPVRDVEATYWIKEFPSAS